MKRLISAIVLVLAFVTIVSAQGRYYAPYGSTGRYMAPDGTVYVNGVPVGRMNPSDLISPPIAPQDPYGYRPNAPAPGTYNPVWNN